MNFEQRWKYFLNAAIPPKIYLMLQKQIIYAAWPTNPIDFVSKNIFLSLLIALASFILVRYYTFSFSWSFLAFFVLFVLSFVIYCIILVLSADSRGREIENLLPEVLRIISANLKAGMTAEKAIWAAVRPEFGPLESELKIVSSETMSNIPLVTSFESMSARIKSSLVAHSVQLLVNGISLGGDMAALLDEVAADMINTQEMKKEIRANVMMYGIFIVFASILASPALFSVSSFYIELQHRLFTNNDLSDIGMVQNSPITVTAPNISVDEVNMFSLAAISVNAFFSAILLGTIFYGEPRRGFKYIPVFLIISLAVFFLARAVLSSMLGNMLI